MTDDSGADCPHCGTPGRRLFFPAGIVFKGSGFYKTDSRRSSSASVNGGGPSAPSKPAGETAAPAGEKTSGTEKGRPRPEARPDPEGRRPERRC
jgi:hypothetical protein